MGAPTLKRSITPPISSQSRWGLLARYLLPQAAQVALMSASLLTAIAVKLANPQVLRHFLAPPRPAGGANPCWPPRRCSSPLPFCSRPWT